MVGLIVVAGVLGLFGWRDLQDLEHPQDDAGWTIFQMGFENQRLLLAAESGADQAELRLRAGAELVRHYRAIEAAALRAAKSHLGSLEGALRDVGVVLARQVLARAITCRARTTPTRSEEHTSALQSH